MTDKSAENPQEPAKQSLDLSSLSGLDFGPSWADGNSKQKKSSKHYDDGGKGRGQGDKHGAGAPRRDRRAGGRPQRSDAGGSGGDGFRREGGGRPPRGERRSGGRGERRGGDRRHAPKPFEPTVKVDLYPQDEAFDALVKRLTATARTYQLFEIAHLLLEKPERFVVVLENKPKPNATGETVTEPLFFSVPGHLPFESEDDAINHVLTNHLDVFFDIEEIEVEPPKGSFQVVNRCGLTGELLGPPNYHRYQEFLQRHYNNRINGTSFERFQAKIETVKEQEVIDAWVDSMKKGARYTLKERAEGEPESFESLEAVRYFLLQNRKDQVVGSGTSVRFAGRDIERMARGNLRRSVEAYCEQQLHFPLDTANNIRGRLRRHKFTVYKKGGKGISYVCAVKRKFRDSKTSFSDSIQSLIEFIEKNPEILASKLSEAYLGIDAEKVTPEKLKMSESAQAAPATVEAKAAEPEAAAEATGAAEPVEAPEAAGDASESAAVSAVEVTPKDVLSPEDHARLESMMIDLRWLITEGYVTEYGDGRLFAAPPMPEPKKKEAAPVEAPAEPAPAAEAPEAPSVQAEAGEPALADEPVVAAADEAEVVAEAPAPEVPADEDKKES
ncbi:MAG: hypothetical protein ACPGKS_04420 [Coraliomargarita sp.]